MSVYMNIDFVHTSGNLQADRRYEYAVQMHGRGDHEQALDLLRQAAEIAPDWPVIPFTIGKIYVDLGQRQEALEAYKQTLALDPEDHQGALLEMQLLGHHVIERAMPRAFVETLFDQYAARFDEHLVERLNYVVPGLIYEAYGRAHPHHMAQRVLDIGCGTGLAGEYFARQAQWLEGVDLSSGMLEAAQTKGIYHRLTHADLQTHLDQSTDIFDVIVAADVFIYLGSMASVFSSAKARLAPGGVLIFSLQKQEDDQGGDFTLDETHRFSHNKAYIEREIAAAGLSLIACDAVILRKDRDVDVQGFIFVCGRDEVLDTGDIANTLIRAQNYL